MRRRDYDYSSGGVVIKLPPGHMLPTYRVSCPEYDSFLPVLAKYVPAGSVIVDVGANCGDTLAAMAEGAPEATFVCIEPEPTFAAYLDRNIAKVREVYPRLTVRTINAMVGRGGGKLVLKSGGGTASAVADMEVGRETERLDDLLLEFESGRIRLVKSDVDGYDFDVIGSAASILMRDAPMLFFECDFRSVEQFRAYNSLFDELRSYSYERFYVFDNFGAFIVSTGDMGVVRDLLVYLFRQLKGGSRRTVHYFDVLAVSAVDVVLAERATAEFRSRGVDLPMSSE